MASPLFELTAQLRALVLTEDAGIEDPQARAVNAARMAQKASQRGDKPAQMYWKGVYARAKARIGKAAGKTPGEGGHGGGHAAPAKATPPAHKKSGGDDRVDQDPSAKKGGIVKRMSGLLKRAASATSAASAAVAKRIAHLPEATRKLVMDPQARRDFARKAADHVKKIPAKALYAAIEEVEEVVMAGAVLLKAARRKELTDQDKHTLKQGAKALATTVLGTVAIGGIAHLTAQALATHFAAETAAKAVGKAALYTAAQALAAADEMKASTAAWAQNVMQGVQFGFASLASMPDDELASIVLGETNQDEPEPE